MGHECLVLNLFIFAGLERSCGGLPQETTAHKNQTESRGWGQPNQVQGRGC